MNVRDFGGGLLLLAALALGDARAGQGCSTAQPQVEQVSRSLALAERAAKALDASGVDLVLLARAGQDLSRWQLRWSHLGWAYRDAAGHWRVVHKLNHCGTARGDVFRQGLAEFFLDDMHEYRTAWVVPTPEVQQRLRPLLVDNQRVATLHIGDYNMVAYPWSQRYQQSNQWALETLALAMEPRADTRERAQSWLRVQGYKPTVLHMSALTRLGANVGSAHIAFDDHPNGERFAGRIATVTVESMFEWMQRSGHGSAVQELRP